MWAEQAVFTSLPRRGRNGYHLVSQSRGVGEEDAQALARWAPSHGALIVDESNRTSVNFHRLPSGRFAISRTCAGPPEYSGRGGQQLYTHFLIVDDVALEAVRFQPISIYRDAMALGYLLYHGEPDDVLQPVRLLRMHRVLDAGAWSARAAELGLPPLGPLHERLHAGDPLRFSYAGDRIALAECLVGMLGPGCVRRISFSTGLEPSSVRPFALALVAATRRPDRTAESRDAKAQMPA
jgi:hypothetical protein